MEMFLSKNLAEQYISTKEERRGHRSRDKDNSMDSQLGYGAFSKTAAPSKDAKSALRHLDPETDYKVRRITSKVNECIHLVANEPSLGLYRIQEHVHRTLPTLVDKKKEIQKVSANVKETIYDLDLSLEVVSSMATTDKYFSRISEALKFAIETKQKINERERLFKEQMAQEQEKAKSANRSISMDEPAEGYICPVCYFALPSQDELIEHWQLAHNKQDEDVDCESCASEGLGPGIKFKDCPHDRELTVIDFQSGSSCASTPVLTRSPLSHASSNSGISPLPSITTPTTMSPQHPSASPPSTQSPTSSFSESIAEPQQAAPQATDNNDSAIDAHAPTQQTDPSPAQSSSDTSASPIIIPSPTPDGSVVEEVVDSPAEDDIDVSLKEASLEEEGQQTDYNAEGIASKDTNANDTNSTKVATHEEVINYKCADVNPTATNETTPPLLSSTQET